MKITTVRRISQVFFVILFLWFCITTTLGGKWWQLRGWPVNWIIELDPLVGLGTLLSTGTLYAGLLWGLLTVLVTIMIGRFFCGWVCPFGAIHQFAGFCAKHRKSLDYKVAINRYSPWQSFKYLLLFFFLAAVFIDLAGIVAPGHPLLAGSLQIGLLDPICLLYRSVNLTILSIVDGSVVHLSASRRFYDGAWVIGTIFMAAIFLNFFRPRFYCRYICPLGALFGILSRFAVYRIGKARAECSNCELCEKHCEGACSPTSQIRINECVLCMNCINDCRHNLMAYRIYPSESGEQVSPDITRRGLVVSIAVGLFIPPMLRLSGGVSQNWDSAMVRPPGSVVEEEFLKRCIKCGQCMRICPTNVIQPAGLETGLEALWTPSLNFRVGTSGCQHNCIACGNICPTAAIRPITLDERMGTGMYENRGPLRIGMAFVDHGRCLPWAMGLPCIVCQENCPVSPKAIFTRSVFQTVRDYTGLQTKHIENNVIEISNKTFESGRFSTGDYFLRFDHSPDSPPFQIAKNSENKIEFNNSNTAYKDLSVDSLADILILLQQPYVDPEKCIGCGICQHECPVKGKRAIRVNAENESRNPGHSFLLLR
ncbi:MAG: 4Fe-4S binding protein [Desulfobacterales bacterium]